MKGLRRQYESHQALTSAISLDMAIAGIAGLDDAVRRSWATNVSSAALRAPDSSSMPSSYQQRSNVAGVTSPEVAAWPVRPNRRAGCDAGEVLDAERHVEVHVDEVGHTSQPCRRDTAVLRSAAGPRIVRRATR